MLLNNLEKKEKKAVRKPRLKTVRSYFFDSFNQVAPLSWIPLVYQKQLKVAKPVRLYKSKTSRKRKIPLQ